MSTFDGRVSEFPDIRIDYFRVSPKDRIRPLAFFLSHVHADHLAGLESCKSPFIYCSVATREILLRLEKYPHRMNFTKGILETRKQTYRHLQTLLKTIPYETPTNLELAPGRHIRVTLFDANHCTGSTTFLIEDETHAVMYTGDLRSEKWWVDSLTRSPFLIPYTAKATKKLDCIYLDTTFATSSAPYRSFPTKQDGISELLCKVSRYPSDTVFYFDTWTFGYEDVWLALSAFLRSKIHVDDYRYALYCSLAKASGSKPNEAHQLIGYYCGNHFQEGCLTRSQARLHSCEYGTGCEVFDREFVRITPIITRYENIEIHEMGIGGGLGDIDQRHELELGDDFMLQSLLKLCHDKLKDTPVILEQAEQLIRGLSQEGSVRIDQNVLHSAAEEIQPDIADMLDLPLEALVPALVKLIEDRRGGNKTARIDKREEDLRPDGLPKRITFPYSRHASYGELRLLIEAFLPKEIHPCTVELDNWTEELSMQELFGNFYSGSRDFQHDRVTFARVEFMKRMTHAKEKSQTHNDPPLKHKEVPSLAEAAVKHGSIIGAELPGDCIAKPLSSLIQHDGPVADVVTSVLDADDAVARPTRNIVRATCVDDTTTDRQSVSSELVTAQECDSMVGSGRLCLSSEAGNADDQADDIPSLSPRQSSSDDNNNDGIEQQTSHTNALLRRTMQHEAFDAALGLNGHSWHDIELVSLRSREQELEL